MKSISVAAVLLCGSVLLSQEKKSAADVAIADATAVLQKALAAAKEPEEKAKLRVAVAALKAIDPPPGKVQNELISDFRDNPEKYMGRTLTFRVRFYNRGGLSTLRDRIGGADGVPFVGTDPRNKAELKLGLSLPANMVAKEVPAADHEEEVIVTFRCTQGSISRGNVAERITRPK